MAERRYKNVNLRPELWEILSKFADFKSEKTGHPYSIPDIISSGASLDAKKAGDETTVKALQSLMTKRYIPRNKPAQTTLSKSDFEHYAHVYDNGGLTALISLFELSGASVAVISAFFKELEARDGTAKE